MFASLWRLPRMVIWIVATTLYMSVFTLSLGLYVVSSASSIPLGQLSAAIYLGLWGLFAVWVTCEIDRCWGYTRLEHILTSIVYVCIGLAMYNCLANLFVQLTLPTLDQLAPPIAAIDSSSTGVIFIVLPVAVFVTIQRRRAGARRLD